jgi:predicted RNA-binding Zn-ribbon protein involved in translation (DUF1610 family)
MSLVSINDVLKITTRVEKLHPYKVVGDRDSYSPYNEGWSDCISLIESYLEQIPFAESERKNGEWIKIGHWGRSYKCNQCGNSLDFDGVNVGRGDVNFCPNCGAEMRGE